MRTLFIVSFVVSFGAASALAQPTPDPAPGAAETKPPGDTAKPVDTETPPEPADAPGAVAEPPVAVAPPPRPAPAPAPMVAKTSAPQKALIMGFGDLGTLRVGLQYRARFLANGMRDLAEDTAAEMITHRARVTLDARIKKWWRVVLQLQDVRAWGTEVDTLGDFNADAFDAHQAFFEINSPSGASLRVGRQELAYNGQRIIGSVDWTDQARSFDAARIAMTFGAIQAHVFYALTGESDAGAADDTGLAGLWFNYGASPLLNASLLMLFDHADAEDRSRVTAGVHLEGLMQGLKYTAEFYYQMGKRNPGGTELTIGAMLAAARVGYTLGDVPMKPTIEVFFDFLSGDDDGSDDKDGMFNTLFATNHKFYGFMDFFLNIPAQTGGLGLMDFGGRVAIMPMKGVKAFVDVHHLRAVHAFNDGTNEESTFGTEIDAVINVKINHFFSLQGGFGVFLPGRALTCVQGVCRDGKTELFGYTTANFSI